MTFQNILLSVLLTPFFIPPAQAFQDYIVQKNQRIEATLSQSNLNRIAFASDRIQQVFGGDGFDLEIDRKFGQIFIKPLSGKIIHLSLVTEKGLTQDLTLSPKKVSPQTIILKEEIKKTEEHGETLKETPYHKSLKRFLKAIMEGETPEGFEIEERSSLSSRTFPGLTIENLKTYKGESLVGEIYTVKNNSTTPITLSEETIAEHGDRAISLSHVIVSPEEVSQIYIIRSIRRG